MSKIANWELNQINSQGNIISGYQDIAKNVTREQAITDYLYYLETSEGVENPKCECVEIDWEQPNTVKIYQVTITKAYRMDEQGTGYSLTPWNGDTEYYEGYDNGGKDYILPEGYEVAESVLGDNHIYNAKGEHCTLSKKFNSPCLVTAYDEIMMARVKD